MNPGEVRLAIDCGSAATVAVLAWTAGGWLALQFDGGQSWLSSAVFLGDGGGEVGTGQQAWQRAGLDPARFEAMPLRRAGEDRVKLGPAEVDVVDLVAATLRRVAGEAARVAGGPVRDVRLVVPAAWGPRRCTWMRQAAHRAGLGEVTLVPAPIAVAEHLVASGVRLPVGSFLAVCDVGAGVEASVLRRGPAGFELLSTLDDSDAGGTRIDHTLTDWLQDLHTGAPGSGVVSDGTRWQLLESARTAKEALSELSTVTVGMPPPSPPVVLSSVQVEAVARPVLQQAGRLTAEAVAAAELEPHQLTGVYVAGGGAAMPFTAQAVGEATGQPSVVVAEPRLAAALSAAHAGGPVGGPPISGGPPIPEVVGPPVPPLSRAATLIVPALASLALLLDFLWTRPRAGGGYDDVYHYRSYSSPGIGYGGGDFGVKMNWGELGMAATLALVACLCAATVLAAVLPVNAGFRTTVGSDGVQMGGGLLVATGLGVAAGGLYAAGAAQYIVAPIAPFLRWTMLPVLPLVAIVVTVAALAARWGRRPATGWHAWLRFPIDSIIPATTGMLLIQYLHWNWYDDKAWVTGLERLGGLLIGIGAAFALVQPWLYRLIVAVPLAVDTAAITSVDSTGILGMIYVLAVTTWWLQRLWQLIYRPPQPWLPTAPTPGGGVW